MTVKQYLKQAYRLDALIDADLAELNELKHLALSVSSPKLTGMPSSGYKQEVPFVNSVQKIVDLEAHINAEVDRFVDLKAEIRYFLEQMQDKNQRAVLQYRYVLFYPWDVIADKMGYTVQWVHQIHRDALISFDKVMKTTN